MQATHLSLSGSIKIINGVGLTPREIDIIACLLSGKGTKAIATLLSMSPRTVETHTRAIMIKFGCNSKEGIIEFIEHSKQFYQLKNHYLHLLQQAKFKQALQKIALLNKNQLVTYVVCSTKSRKSQHLIDELTVYLNLAGLKIKVEKRPKIILPELAFIGGAICKEEIGNLAPVLFVLSDLVNATEVPDEIRRIGYVNFDLDLDDHVNTSDSFYEQVFAIIQKLLPDLSLDLVISEFKKDIQVTSAEDLTLLPKHQTLKIHPSKIKSILVFAVLLGVIILGFNLNHLKLFLSNLEKKPNIEVLTQQIRSPLFIPKENALLKRHQLIKILEAKLTDTSEKNEIKTVALVGITGMGGVGKTTLARYYAHLCNYPIVWEINAETRESLLNSFNDLALALAQTKEQKNVLELIQGSQNAEYKEKQLLCFVKNCLKQYATWLLLYDNVENFTAIKPYLPDDVLMWGNGTVILTTRDATIAKTVHIRSENVIALGELSEEEAVSLFCKILYNKAPEDLSTEIQFNIQQFLKYIPAFPLDISVAAYYIKNTGISFKEYLTKIAQDDAKLAKTRGEFLSGIINYDKTRYGIIALSFKKIIEKNPVFADLLLYICLLDSQDVPEEILSFYKDKNLTESFLHFLRKYSLITTDFKEENRQVFSIHRSTQQMGLNFLLQDLQLPHKDALIQAIAASFDKYLANVSKTENIATMKILVSHCEKFLSHNLLKKTTEAALGVELGTMYYALLDYAKAQTILKDNIKKLNQYDYLKMAQALMTLGIITREITGYEEARQLLEKALAIYQQYFPKDYAKICKTLVSLGQVNKNLGEYAKAENLLKESLTIYQTYLPENYLGLIKNLYHLGHVYQDIGQYSQAQELLEQSIALHKKYFPNEEDEMVSLLVYIGNLYRDFGQYEKAKQMLEASLQHLRNQNIAEEHVDFAWAAIYLGEIYRTLGDLETAQKLIEKGFKVYLDNLAENHAAIGIALEYLGKLYLDLGFYNKAQQCLEQSLVIYEKNYGKKPHLKIGNIFNTLGNLSMQKNALLQAEFFIKQALAVFEAINHPNKYMALESLANLYLQKSEQYLDLWNYKDADAYNHRAINCLARALEVVTRSFNMFSYHAQRIQRKINAVRQRVTLQSNLSSSEKLCKIYKNFNVTNSIRIRCE